MINIKEIIQDLLREYEENVGVDELNVDGDTESLFNRMYWALVYAHNVLED